MVEDKYESQELSWKQLFPWTELFQGFRIALDLNKLLLAAGGIVTMALGWWLLATLTMALYDKPQLKSYPALQSEDVESHREAWRKFKTDLGKWALIHEAAGSTPEALKVEDVADSSEEHDKLSQYSDSLAPAKLAELVQQGKITPQESAKLARVGSVPPYGTLRTLPWSEDRGPNPYLLVTGRAGIPWEAGHFWDWLITKEAPVLVEPLAKLFKPIGYYLDSRSGVGGKLYFLLVLLWTVATWALFGGAITRIAAVQIARQEKIGFKEALRFTVARYVHYATAPVLPLIAIAILLIIMILAGIIGLIPILGDIVIFGLFWPLFIILGLGMTVALIGLVGWPLMSATISAEGTDSWEAVSRSYNYVFQAPWNFAWYCVVSLAYGAVVVFFVGFVGSLSVGLAKWGVKQTPFIESVNRDPGFLFVYAPRSFGWRELLMDGTHNSEGVNLVTPDGKINEEAYNVFLSKRGREDMSPWNFIGAGLVSGFWLSLIFLLVVGFGYSYFWSSSTIIYMLMRRKVDDAELDEVYLEEDDRLEPPLYTPATPAAAPGGSSSMVEAPTLRTPAPPPAPTPAPVEAAPTSPSPSAPTSDGTSAPNPGG